MTDEALTTTSEDMPVDLWLEFKKLRQNIILYPFGILLCSFNLWARALEGGIDTGLVWFWGIFALAAMFGVWFETRRRVKRIEKAVAGKLNLSPARVS